jgi:hypothetical protein
MMLSVIHPVTLMMMSDTQKRFLKFDFLLREILKKADYW